MNGKHLNEGPSTHSYSKLESESEAGILLSEYVNAVHLKICLLYTLFLLFSFISFHCFKCKGMLCHHLLLLQIFYSSMEYKMRIMVILFNCNSSFHASKWMQKHIEVS